MISRHRRTSPRAHQHSTGWIDYRLRLRRRLPRRPDGGRSADTPLACHDGFAVEASASSNPETNTVARLTAHPVADVGGVRRVDDPDDVQLDPRRQLVEEP